ncbi:hypothetical protein [Candidatus Bealeia paramacronuclearis]|uniref:hypothetical protein n=1 Tax=Candidatus Bealeia paramacronuclearis TaxID=1921001 RepID=UPI002F266F3D
MKIAIFDIHGTVAWPLRENEFNRVSPHIPTLKKLPTAIDNLFHITIPYIEVLMNWLLEHDWKIIFFTAADKEVGEGFVNDLVTSFWPNKKVQNLKDQVQFQLFTREHIKIVKGPHPVKPNLYSEVQKKWGNPKDLKKTSDEGVPKKSLRSILGDQFPHAILFEDSSENVDYGEEVHVPLDPKVDRLKTATFDVESYLKNIRQEDKPLEKYYFNLKTDGLFALNNAYYCLGILSKIDEVMMKNPKITTRRALEGILFKENVETLIKNLDSQLKFLPVGLYKTIEHNLKISLETQTKTYLDKKETREFVESGLQIVQKTDPQSKIYFDPKDYLPHLYQMENQKK